MNFYNVVWHDCGASYAGPIKPSDVAFVGVFVNEINEHSNLEECILMMCFLFGFLFGNCVKNVSVNRQKGKDIDSFCSIRSPLSACVRSGVPKY